MMAARSHRASGCMMGLSIGRELIGSSAEQYSQQRPYWGHPDNRVSQQDNPNRVSVGVKVVWRWAGINHAER